MDKMLVDTDILIDVSWGVTNAIQRLDIEAQASLLTISVITQMELLIGCRNKNELRILDHFLKRFDILQLNENISTNAIDLLRKYRLSHGLLIADSLIAATALYLEIPLLTKNQSDYVYIDEIKVLRYP
ncbi:type II toxin-antitoxin system VapC family toxin [candidate division KSB1 bacterium]|nr:type II toxin-antitoxin system VapC family toxin [candidate division KSB1 bacterium]